MRAVFSCSLLWLLVALSWGDTSKQYLDRLRVAPNPAAKSKVVTAFLEEYTLYEVEMAFTEAEKRKPLRPADFTRIEKMIAAFARLETMPPAPQATSRAKQIKASPLYVDHDKEQSNWLSNALARLKNLKLDWPKSNIDTPVAPAGLGTVLIYSMWGILGVALLVFAFFAIRYVQLNLKLKKREHQILDEEEEVGSLDEWLTRADALERQGEYRLAVRALYLACLLQFDRSLVARFDRGQTNWEHLARIQQSPRRPAEINFLPPTQRFDVVWYGHRVRGAEDVQELRAAYQAITTSLKERAA